MHHGPETFAVRMAGGVTVRRLVEEDYFDQEVLAVPVVAHQHTLISDHPAIRLGACPSHRHYDQYFKEVSLMRLTVLLQSTTLHQNTVKIR